MIQHYYKDADDLAIYYANLFRSSFLIGCFLGASAITVAALGGLWHWFWWPVIEIVVLAFLFLNFWLSKSCCWQQKLTYYRYVAEQLRHFKQLRQMGWVIPRIQATPHSNKVESIRGIRWYLRNVVRWAGVPRVVQDEDWFGGFKTKISEWIKEQEEYHHKNHSRYHRLETRLTIFTTVFFIATVVFLGLHLMHLWFDKFYSLMTIVLPVWAMAAHALGQYSEANRLADRSEAMEERLRTLRLRAEQCKTTDELDAVAQEAAFLMLQEVADWHVQYQMTSPALV